jgi:hypothetical protein
MTPTTEHRLWAFLWGLLMGLNAGSAVRGFTHHHLLYAYLNLAFVGISGLFLIQELRSHDD